MSETEEEEEEEEELQADGLGSFQTCLKPCCKTRGFIDGTQATREQKLYTAQSIVGDGFFWLFLVCSINQESGYPRPKRQCHHRDDFLA